MNKPGFFSMTSAEEVRHNLQTLEDQLGASGLRALLEETTAYLTSVHDQLRLNRRADDWSAIARQLHQLKGGLLIFGSAELKALLEAFPKEPQVSDKNSLADAISVKILEARSLIRSWLDEL